MKTKQRVYILGAGVSGLVTAQRLARAGWDVTVFEKEPYVGGLAFTRKWDEFHLDFGPHIYHTVSRELEAVWEKEFGDLFVKGEFWCKNVKGESFDELYDYPLSYESISEYPALLKEKIFKELKELDTKNKTSAKNYRDYVRALVGPTLQELFFENYPKKLWGLTTLEMTSNWAPKRIELREKRKPFYTGRWSAVGKYGSGCIMERIAGEISSLGGKICLGKGIKEILYSDRTLTGLRLFNDELISLEPEDIVISTIPLNLLARLFQIDCHLDFRGVISVALAFHKPYLLPDGLHFLYYDSPEIVFHRLSEQKKFSSAGFPKDRTFVTAEIAYSPKDEWDQTPDKDLIRRVLDDVVKVRLAKKEDFDKGIVQKRPCVYPLLTQNYEHRVREVQSRLAQFKSLYIVGGPAEYNYADIHINYLKAIDLSEILIDRYSDFYKVRRDRVVVKRKKEVPLNGRWVGDGHPPFIIAEAGLNHNGDRDMALKLIAEAKKAHCDAVKFQTFSAAGRVSNKIKRANYAEQIIGLEENIFEMFRRLELSKEDHKHLFEHARKIGIDVFSTPFDLPSVELLESLNTPYYKVASSDLNNIPLLERIAKTGKPMILSTGMSTLGEIEESIEAILRMGNPNIILLHCLSSYPAHPEEINLNVIKTLKNNFQVPVGFSDHTPGIHTSVAALAIGANVIERHFTLDRKLEGPDHIFSSMPAEMSELVRFAKLINPLLGDGTKRIQPSEYETINSFKKTLYAQKNIKQGTTITEDHLAIKGPAGGLPPKYFSVVVGRIAKRDIESDHPITWEDI